MTVPFNIGVLQLSMEPVQETVAMAKACEDAGFDTFWIAEAYPWGASTHLKHVPRLRCWR